jgi:hypothetical protein
MPTLNPSNVRVTFDAEELVQIAHWLLSNVVGKPSRDSTEYVFKYHINPETRRVDFSLTPTTPPNQPTAPSSRLEFTSFMCSE